MSSETSDTIENGGSTKPTTDPRERPSRAELYRCLREQLVQEAVPLAVGSLALLGSSLSNQAFPRLMGRLIDNDVPGRSLGWIVVGGGLASFLRTTLLRSSKDSIASRLRLQAFASLLGKDFEWFQASNDSQTQTPTSPAALAAVLSQDVDQMATMLTTTLANVLRSASAVAFSAYHMLRLDPQLLGASASVIPLIGAAAMLLRRSVKRLLEEQRRHSTDAASFVEERIANVALVQLAHRQEYEIEQYQQLQSDALRHDRRVARYQGGLMGFLFVSSAAGLLWVVHLGGQAVARGRLTSGQLTSFATYSFLLGLGTSGLVQGMGEWTRGTVAAERYLPLWSRSAEPSESDTSANTNPSDASGTAANGRMPQPIDKSDVSSIALESVSFGYKSSSEPVLHHVSLVLDRGTVTALVGRNGSGKTTTVALLAGLLRPGSGRVVLSTGHALSDLPPAVRAQLIQFVPQSTAAALWDSSILENVRYCRPDSSEADVRRALERAGCAEWVDRLPHGLHHRVGRGGCHLSGGQAQRLVLARALLSDPAVLLLDEPASHLDAAGETAVARALVASQRRQDDGDEAKSRPAVAIVTHNPKSLELVDRIVVLQDGSVVEVGTLQELRHPRSQLCHIMPDLLD